MIIFFIHPIIRITMNQIFRSQNVIVYSINALFSIEVIAPKSGNGFSTRYFQYSCLFGKAGSVNKTPINGGVCAQGLSYEHELGLLTEPDNVSSISAILRSLGPCSGEYLLNGNIPFSLYKRTFGDNDFSSSPFYYSSTKVSSGTLSISLDPSDLSSANNLSGVKLSIDFYNTTM